MNGPAYPPAFRARAPWWGGDLQTLRSRILQDVADLPGKSQRLTVPLQDGSGDKLVATLNTPADPPEGPLVVLIHGLAGSEDSPYVRASTAFHLQRRRRVLRVNLRGAGPSRASCSGQYHGGCSPDIRAILASLDDVLISEGIFLIGFSLGGNILLNLLAITGVLPVVGAVTVSASIEPTRVAERLMAPRNWLYQRWLLASMKQECTAPGACLSDAERIEIDAARSIYAFDDGFTAPRNGYADAADYYTRTSGAQKIPDIRVPLLMLHARDDPWIPVDIYEALEPNCPPNVTVILSHGGGHVGFHAKGHMETWHDRYADAFLGAISLRCSSVATLIFAIAFVRIALFVSHKVTHLFDHNGYLLA